MPLLLQVIRAIEDEDEVGGVVEAEDGEEGPVGSV